MASNALKWFEWFDSLWSIQMAEKGLKWFQMASNIRLIQLIQGVGPYCTSSNPMASEWFFYEVLRIDT